ncbi:MAG: hypothetical protein COB46_01175 [Rhodospirillaceae bacterium]|nr:MAG: hypothetical protein COB46_01175 [Rhodospirillaceae bacterium]
MNSVVKKNTEEWKLISKLAEERKSWMNKGDGGKSMMPHSICLALNNYCFMRCHMCDVGAAIRDKDLKDDMMFFYARQTGGEKAYSLPIEDIKNLIDDVASFKPIIRANFLEPLLRDDIAEIARYVSQAGLQFYIQTNGYLLPKHAHALLEAGVRNIRVSVDGPEAVHNDIRGVKDSWKKAMEGLRMVVDWKKRHKVDYPLVGLSFTLSDLNYDTILDFYREIADLNLAEDIYIAFNHLKYSTKAEADEHNATHGNHFNLTETSLSSVDISKIDADVISQQFEALDREFPKDIFKRHVNPLLTKDEMHQWYDGESYLNPETACYEPWTVAQIHFDGEVGINGRCIAPNFGNIREQKFTDIWNSDAAQDFRRLVRKHPDLPSCNRCNRNFRKQT